MAKRFLMAVLILGFMSSTFHSYSQIKKLPVSDYDVTLEIVNAEVSGWRDNAFYYGYLPRVTNNCQEYIYFTLKVTNIGRHTVYGIPIGGDYFLNGKKIKKLNLQYAWGTEGIYGIGQHHLKQDNIIYDGNPYDKKGKENLGGWELPFSSNGNVRIKGGISPGSSFYVVVWAPFKPTKATYSEGKTTIDGKKLLNTYTFYIAGMMYKYEGNLTNIGVPTEKDGFSEVHDQISNNSYIQSTYWALCVYGLPSRSYNDPIGESLMEEKEFKVYSNKLQKNQSTKNLIGSMYPNPVESGQSEYLILDSKIEYPERLLVEINNPNSLGWIRVNGVYKNGSIELDTSGLAAGTHYIRISYPGQEVKIHRLIVR